MKHSSKLKGVPDMCLRGGEAEIFQAKFLESVLWKDLIFYKIYVLGSKVAILGMVIPPLIRILVMVYKPLLFILLG